MASTTTILRVLTPADVAACVAVENAAFTNPGHRASAETFAYRLHACPELCLGAFAEGTGAEGPVLIAHMVGTRCSGPVVTHASMGHPPGWREKKPEAAAAAAADTPGHQPHGTTVAVHSLAVTPAAQRQGLGTRLVTAYLARMGGEAAHGVSRVSILCQEDLVDYYKKLGFSVRGPSATQFGGGGWLDMFYDLPRTDDA